MKGSSGNADRIDLSLIDANPSLSGNQAFKFVTSFTAAKGEVRFVTQGTDTIVQVDIDSDPAPEMIIRVVNVTGLHGFDLIL